MANMRTYHDTATESTVFIRENPCHFKTLWIVHDEIESPVKHTLEFTAVAHPVLWILIRDRREVVSCDIILKWWRITGITEAEHEWDCRQRGAPARWQNQLPLTNRWQSAGTSGAISMQGAQAAGDGTVQRSRCCLQWPQGRFWMKKLLRLRRQTGWYVPHKNSCCFCMGFCNRKIKMRLMFIVLLLELTLQYWVSV